MFKFEFDAIAKGFSYEKYMEGLSVVNPEVVPVQYLTYWYLCHAFDHQMRHDLKGETNAI